MKSDFKTKLIQHMLNKKNGEKGFTLIELLVVIIIIGILAAIALPSFLNQANKARQSEAKSYVGSMNRAQQAYFLEKATFATGIASLGLGIKTTTEYYNYPAPVTSVASQVFSAGDSTKASLKAYSGITWLGTTASGGTEAATLAGLCETINANTAVTGTTALVPTVTAGRNDYTCNAAEEKIK